MATIKKPIKRDRTPYANTEEKYIENVGKVRTAQDKVRIAKELNKKARSSAVMQEANTPLFGIDNTGRMFGPSRRQAARDRITAADKRETRLRAMDDKNAASLKQAVANVRAGPALKAHYDKLAATKIAAAKASAAKKKKK